MSIDAWTAYVGFVLVVVVTPGPSVLLSAATGMTHGVRKTMATVAGDLSANVLQMGVASAGLGIALQASATAFQTVKWCGIAYLVYLGATRWLRPPTSIESVSSRESKSRRALFIQGFLVSASNPKAVLFFLALFPQFFDPHGSRVAQLLILGATFVVLDGTALILYACFARQIRRLLMNRDRLRWLDRITGSFYVGAALALARVKRD